MAQDNFNIVIPMAGFGKRLRPHTWSKPKPLVSAAGKAVLGHVLDILGSAPNVENAAWVFIVGYLGEQVEAYIGNNYPDLNAHYFEQKEMLGQSHAIALAKDFLKGPTLILFVDTLSDMDLSFLKDEKADAVIWVKEVEDPRRFGVVDLDKDGWVRGFIEKPDDMRNNLAIIGYYYFAKGEELAAAIEEQISEDIQTKGEYFIADAMNVMLKNGLKMRAEKVDVWLDAGLPETVLETNRYLLEHGRDNSSEAKKRTGNTIVPPVYIHPGAEVSGSTIGPHVSIGEDCLVISSQIKDSVLEAGAQVNKAVLEGSIIGVRAKVTDIDGVLNIGDDAVVSKE